MKLPEHQVVALIRSANPVAPNDSILDELPAAGVLLDVIETRREAMSDESVQPTSESPRQRRLLALAAAALVVVTVGAAAVFLTIDDTDQDIPPVTEATTVPETTVPETTVPETTVPETTVPETTVPETTTSVAEEATATIAEILAASAAGDPAEFTVLLAALETAGLVDALSTPGDEFTVFAPTDAAFLLLLAELGVTEEELLANPDLSSLLLYHVAPGVFDSAAAVASSPIATLNPGGVELLIEESDGAVTIIRWRLGGNQPNKGEAQVTSPDIAATNGVIHVIDAVLVPSWVQFRYVGG